MRPPYRSWSWTFARRALLPWLVLLLACHAARAVAAQPQSAPAPAPSRSSRVFNVRDYGAAGDGQALDTAALNKAVEACAAAGGGQVLFPPGNYLTGTVHLQSNVTLMLDAGATIVGCPDPQQYQYFTPPAGTPMSRNLKWHRALILGVGVENVAITGRGVIDGNKVFDPTGEERMRGPHAVLFGNAQHVTLRDVSIRDAANYAVMLEFTSHVEVRGVKVTGGWDGVHFRGWRDNPCRDVTITDCELYTGDDCIAGWYWEDTLIARCVLNSSCNGIRLIGPAKNLLVHDCLFFGPGRFEHRSSRQTHRRNMLAGLCLQPGAWDRTVGALEGVKASDLTMHDVTTPLHLSLKPGNTAGPITIDRLTATGAYRAAASVESWAEAPFERVTLRDVSMSFTGGGTEEQAKMAVRSPGVDARPLPAWGVYARNVKELNLENVRLGLDKPDARPAVIAEGVEKLNLDGFRFPEGQPPLSLSNVAHVRAADTPIGPATAHCTDLRVSRWPFAATATATATATIENGDRDGLAKVELKIADRTLIQWIWLRAGERKDVTFAKLESPGPGKHEIRCGELVREWTAP